MAKPISKKTAKSLLEFVRLARSASGLTEGEFACALGLPKPTIKAMCNAKSKRRASSEHLALIRLACGIEFSDDGSMEFGSVADNEPFTPEKYAQWQQIHDMSMPQIRGLIKASMTNAETLLAGAAGRKRLLVALYLFELHLRKLMENLGLTDDITEAEESNEIQSTLSQPEKITSEVLNQCRKSAGL